MFSGGLVMFATCSSGEISGTGKVTPLIVLGLGPALSK